MPNGRMGVDGRQRHSLPGQGSYRKGWREQRGCHCTMLMYHVAPAWQTLPELGDTVGSAALLQGGGQWRGLLRPA